MHFKKSDLVRGVTRFVENAQTGPLQELLARSGYTTEELARASEMVSAYELKDGEVLAALSNQKKATELKNTLSRCDTKIPSQGGVDVETIHK